MGTEILQEALGIKMKAIPYKGDAQVAVDVMGGTIPVGVMALPSIVGQLKDKQMHPIAVLGDSKYDDFPEVPNLAELGYPDDLIQTWLGLIGPAGMPAEVVDKLSEATQAAMASDAVKELMKTQNSRIVASQPADFDNYIEAEHKKWADIVKRVNVAAK
jgi:tripartite-type tricarboxylate transporter receptor subunit TctC